MCTTLSWALGYQCESSRFGAIRNWATPQSSTSAMRCQCCSVALQLFLSTCAPLYTHPIGCSTSSVFYTHLTLPEQHRCHLSPCLSSNSSSPLAPFPLDSKILTGSLTFKSRPASLFSPTHEWSSLVIGFHFHYSSTHHKIISGL
jgi:hypothetical protein